MLRPNRRGRRAPQLSRSFRFSSVRLLLLAALLMCCAGPASAQSAELVQYPSEEVAFICGPQLRANSPSNPYPWFDRVQIEQGHVQGRAFAAVSPRVLTGTVSVRQGSAEVQGTGTRFTREVDPTGPAPLFNGWFRVKLADGNFREMRVASVINDTRLLLTTAWTGASLAGAQADTLHHDPSMGWNNDRYYDSAYYDMALSLYIAYYRTGDPSFLTYARKVADSWWASPYIDHGTVTSGGYNLPPRSMAYAGLMLRALDGRPEMWDYLQRQARAAFDNWVGLRLGDPTLYYDIREDGYAQLYAALLARVLPDAYDTYPQGTLSPSSGRATDGAQKRATFVRDAGRAAVEFFGRLQRADGSWRWDVEGMGLVNVEQPFMLGIYLEAVVALDRVTTDPAVKASLRSQLEKAVRHLYTQAYRGNETVSDLPQYKWRGVWYFWGGGTKEQPTLYERGEGERISGGSTGMIRQVRHLNSTLHQAFGYAYALTGEAEYLRMGEEVFDASYGDKVDGIKGLADEGRGKNYAMNFRASGRFLAWRLQGEALPTPTPTPTPAATPTPTPTPVPTPSPTPFAAQVSISNPLNGAQFVEPAAVNLSADVTPGSGGVSKVEFFDGATLLASVSARPYAFNWQGVAAGTHVLTARVTDWAGQAFTSAAVTIRVVKAGDSLGRARRNAQATSNQLAQTPAVGASGSGVSSSVSAEEVATKLTAVVADVWQAYLDFSAERASFPAALRIEAALSGAVSHARAAESLAQSGGNTPATQASLRNAIDSLMLANVLVVYGDIPNPLDTPEYFVRQHYVDFLGREPDESGQNFWVGRLTGCGTAAQCKEVARIGVSAAYFHSIEFKETGFFLYRLYRATYGRAPLLAEFTPDSQELARGLIVNAEGWKEKIETNKADFLRQWAARAEFRTRFGAMANAQFVDALIANSAVAVNAQERDALVAALGAGETREAVLRRFVELEPVARQQTNAAFVTMEYFGYMRRDPDPSGFHHWLTKLDEFGGDYDRAEMVKAFLASTEYRQRFGRP